MTARVCLCSGRAVEAGAEGLSKVQDSYMYKKLYPVVAPYTDPAVDRITHSAALTAVVDHLRPAAPPGVKA
jgi:hypothetical protein